MNSECVGDTGESGTEGESDEDVKKVVKSARHKRLDEMETTGKNIDNGLKINDWVAISNGKSTYAHIVFY